MAGKREKPEEIVSRLRQVEVLQGQGATIAEAVRRARLPINHPVGPQWHSNGRCFIDHRHFNHE